MSELLLMLRLDVETLSSTRRMLVVFIGLCCLFAAVGGASFALPLIAMAAVFTGLSLFGAVEANRLTLLYGSLPLRRRTVVVSHYVITVLMTLVAVGLGVAVTAVASLLRREPLTDLAASGVGVLGMLFLVLGILIPAYVRWGTKSGAWVALGLVLAVSAIAAFGQRLPMVAEVVRSVAGLGNMAVWGVLVIGLAVLALSAIVSIRIYQRQDH